MAWETESPTLSSGQSHQSRTPWKKFCLFNSKAFYLLVYLNCLILPFNFFGPVECCLRNYSKIFGTRFLKSSGWMRWGSLLMKSFGYFKKVGSLRALVGTRLICIRCVNSSRKCLWTSLDKTWSHLGLKFYHKGSSGLYSHAQSPQLSYLLWRYLTLLVLWYLYWHQGRAYAFGLSICLGLLAHLEHLICLLVNYNP